MATRSRFRVQECGRLPDDVVYGDAADRSVEQFGSETGGRLVKWRFALTTSNKTMCSFRSRYLRLRGFEGWEQPDTQPPSCRASTCALRTHWSRPVTTAAPSYTRALAGDFRKSAGESGEVTCQ